MMPVEPPGLKLTEEADTIMIFAPQLAHIPILIVQTMH